MNKNARTERWKDIRKMINSWCLDNLTHPGVTAYEPGHHQDVCVSGHKHSTVTWWKNIPISAHLFIWLIFFFLFFWQRGPSRDMKWLCFINQPRTPAAPLSGRLLGLSLDWILPLLFSFSVQIRSGRADTRWALWDTLQDTLHETLQDTLQDTPGLVDCEAEPQRPSPCRNLACMFHYSSSLSAARRWTGQAWTSRNLRSRFPSRPIWTGE